MDVIEQLDEIISLVNKQAAQVEIGQMGNQTPCKDFAVRDVFDHMLGGAGVVAAQLRGVEPTPIDPSTLTDRDRLEAFPPAMIDLLEAAKAPGALERQVTLPFGTVPGEVVARFLTVDGLVHAWDMARATGGTYDPSEETVERTLATAKELIAPEMRDGDTFAAEVTVPDDAPAIDRLVAFTGRQP